MGTPNGRESCGRCSFSTVVDAVESGDEDDDEAERRTSDPFAAGAIEVDERDLELASAPAVLAGRVRNWLDETAHRLIYG